MPVIPTLRSGATPSLAPGPRPEPSAPPLQPSTSGCQMALTFLCFHRAEAYRNRRASETWTNRSTLSRETERAAQIDIVTVLAGRPPPDRGGPGVDVQRIDRTLSKAIERVIDQAGIQPSQRRRRAADYAPDRLI